MTEPPSGLLAGDIVIICVFIFCALYKGGTGFYRSLVPLLATALAVVGAIFVTRLLMEPVMDVAYPWARKWLYSHMDFSGIRTPTLGDIASQLDKLLPAQVANLMRRLQMEVVPFVDAAIKTAGPTATPQSIAEDAMGAILLPVTQSVVRILLFLVSFIALKILFNVLLKLLCPVFKLPVIAVLDWLGGAVIGIAWCAAALFVICWLADLAFPQFFDQAAKLSRILTAIFRPGT